MTKRLDLTPEQRRERHREMSRNKQRQYRREKRIRPDRVYDGGIKQFIKEGHRHVPPPPEVIAEAAAAYSAPRDLTAMIAGDPPRGRSALDQRGKP